MILSTLKETNRRILPLQIAILPLIFLVTLLSFNLYANVFIYDADPLAGSSQFILILSGAFAALIGHRYNVSYKDVINSISNSIKSSVFSLNTTISVLPDSAIGVLVPGKYFIGLTHANKSSF